jgi:hypothetical protein
MEENPYKASDAGPRHRSNVLTHALKWLLFIASTVCALFAIVATIIALVEKFENSGPMTRAVLFAAASAFLFLCCRFVVR